MLALEDGFRLHRLIDPETTPADSFLRAIGDLQRAMGISSHSSVSEWAPSLQKPRRTLPPACTLCNWPATARILPGPARQIASADSALTPIPITKAKV